MRNGAKLLILSLFIQMISVIAPYEGIGQSVTVTDIANQTAFQDTALGHLKRGRACVAADFDLDGYQDFYMGNPGDESIVMRCVPQGNNQVSYVLQQILLTGNLAWGGVSLDYDNDGDYDLFIACGGNEGIGLDYLFRNDWILNGEVTGILQFTDVTAVAGVAGPVPDGETSPVATASAGAVVSDYDRDGDGDIFVNTNNKDIPDHPELVGRNTLWRNNGDGTFTDVSVASGLGIILSATRHSTFFDYDNDGDDDLYENNYHDFNRLWRNNGDGTFTDVTADLSAPGHDLGYPFGSFASATADLNNDGWQDLIVFMRGSDEGTLGAGNLTIDCGCGACPRSPQPDGMGGTPIFSPYPDGHALFINNGGTSFENVAINTIVNDNYVSDPELGVMGCQVGDINGDGIPDIYVGNGGPISGEADQFFLSTGMNGNIPVYTHSTSLIDFPAEIPPGISAPPYPYRTHGVSFVDVDNDGTLEIAVSNGGPSAQPDDVREPDRLFKFSWPSSTTYLKLQLVGDGETVSRDAIGTRVAILVSNRSLGTRWTVYRTLLGGSAFSAQNGFELHFGLGDADSIQTIKVNWPDGSEELMAENILLNSSLVIEHGPIMTSAETETGRPWAGARTISLMPNYPNPFNPSTVIQFTIQEDAHVVVGIYDALGKEVVRVLDEFQGAGRKSITWNGRDNEGSAVSSGPYFVRVRVGNQIASHRMLLVK
jgi:hypothetical protein